MSWIGAALGYLGFSRMDGRAVAASPFSDSTLERIVVSDLYGFPALAPIDRAQAMSLSAVSRGRTIITGAIASTPLRLYVEGETTPWPLAATPWWLNHTRGVLSAYQRMTWTLDDGVFHGEALWAVLRDDDGAIVEAEHVPYAQWRVDTDGTVLIGTTRMRPDQYVWFPFHVEGFLTRGERTLRSALAVERGVEERATNPIPLIVISSVNQEDDLSPTQAREYVDGFRTARATAGGAVVMYLPSYLKAEAFGDKSDSGHAIDARNALRIDFANHLGIAASRLEGTTAEASLTYTTQEGDQAQLESSTDLGPWMDDITTRLSQPDVIGHGVEVRFQPGMLLEANPVSADVTAPVEVSQ